MVISMTGQKRDVKMTKNLKIHPLCYIELNVNIKCKAKLSAWQTHDM